MGPTLGVVWRRGTLGRTASAFFVVLEMALLEKTVVDGEYFAHRRRDSVSMMSRYGDTDSIFAYPPFVSQFSGVRCKEERKWHSSSASFRSRSSRSKAR